jgi:post-segregation antitoxin (ccd killing protein)
VKNITVTVDDETYRRARLKAAERDTSVSALVKAALQKLASEESGPEAAKRRERELRDSIKSFSAADRLPRSTVHERR